MNPAPVSRRSFLSGSASVAALAAMAQIPAFESAAAAPAIPGGGYPFRLGVASGSPQPDGVVLWTRLVPDLFVAGGGMPRRKVPVDWKVATDPGMHHVVRHGSAWALPQLAHSVHVQLRGLRPDRDYFYQFRYRQDVTEVAHTRTAPNPRAPIGSLAFAAASCQKWDDGYYSAYRAMAEEDIDFVLHLGDYVYEYGIDRNGGHRETPVPRSSGRRRSTFRAGGCSTSCTRATRSCSSPTAGSRSSSRGTTTRSPTTTPTPTTYSGDIAAVARRPTKPGTSTCRSGRPPTRRAHPRASTAGCRWGDLMRSTCSTAASTATSRLRVGRGQACEAAYDPAISMLGRDRRTGSYDGLRRSDARWTVLGSNVMMARLDHDGDLGDLLWNDAWDGFPEARNRLADSRPGRGAQPDGPERRLALDLRQRHPADFDKPGSPVIATEFVGTSISSNGDTPSTVRTTAR